MKRIIQALILFSVIIIFACNKEDKDNCISYDQASIFSADAPSTGLANQNIPIDISFQCRNGCGHFGSIEETILGDLITIKAIAKYEGCACFLGSVNIQTTHSLNISTAGVYYLRFLQSDNNYLSDTLIVQ
ncbi:MAG: hypothetical protein H7Y00_08545 [Fimbriimonadaceae bacterium]|nr:hypothetical protein [Chitinophagales bacterium]